MSKALGEINDKEHVLTIRCSIIGREITKKVSFLEWFLSNVGGKVNGYTDVHYSGLTTEALSNMMVDIIKNHPNLHGLYHASCFSSVKYRWLEIIKEKMNLDIEIEPFKAGYCDRSLDHDKLYDILGYMPDREEMIQGLVDDKTPY